MALADRSRLRLAILCGLYLVQGVPTGFVSIGLAAYLAGQGADVAAIAQLLAVSWVPWGFKVVYGPLVDRFSGSAMGRRRPWMLLAQSGMALMLGAMIAVPDLETRVAVLTAMIFAHNLFSALQDVAVDALAVDLLEPGERGRANGMMWSAKIGGIALGGAGLGTVLAHTGLDAALGLMLSGVLLAMGLPLTFREREGERRFPWSAGAASADRHPAPDGFRDVLLALRRVLQTRRALVVGLLALLASLPTRMMVTLGPVFAVQRIGWDDAAFAQFTGGPALLAGVAGALTGGWLADRVGFRWVLGASMGGIFLGFNLFAFVEPWWNADGLVEGFLVVAVFLDMTLRMALFALFMHTAKGRVAATQFSVFMALSNLCNVLGSIVIVPLDYYFDYQGIFLCAAGFTVLTILLLRWLPHRARPVPVAS